LFAPLLPLGKRRRKRAKNAKGLLSAIILALRLAHNFPPHGVIPANAGIQFPSRQAVATLDTGVRRYDARKEESGAKTTNIRRKPPPPPTAPDFATMRGASLCDEEGCG
jgi:hypothetical protein